MSLKGFRCWKLCSALDDAGRSTGRRPWYACCWRWTHALLSAKHKRGKPPLHARVRGAVRQQPLGAGSAATSLRRAKTDSTPWTPCAAFSLSTPSSLQATAKPSRVLPAVGISRRDPYLCRCHFCAYVALRAAFEKGTTVTVPNSLRRCRPCRGRRRGSRWPMARRSRWRR